MSEDAKKHRAAAKAKAHRMATGSNEKLDASSWTPSPDLEADVQTGERPISRNAHKRGGKVKGEHEHKRADRKPRKAGGRNIGDDIVNRDVKEANEKREGARKYGDGLKRGGRTHKDAGGSMVPTERMAFQNGPSQMSRAAGLKHGGHADAKEDEKLIHHELREAGEKPHSRKSGGGNWIAGATKNKGALHRKLGVPEGEKIPEKKLVKAEHSSNPTEKKEADLAKTLKHLHHKKDGGSVEDGELEGTRPEKGGRMAHARGGKAKKGAMNVNIIIGAGHGTPPSGPMGGMGPPPAPAGPPRAVPVAPPTPALGAAPMGMPPPPMAANMPPAGGMNMPRKRGGRTGYPIEDGAGSGPGRLEKIGRHP